VTPRQNRLAVWPVRTSRFGPNLLIRRAVHVLPDAHVLITDQANNRIIEGNLKKEHTSGSTRFEHTRRTSFNGPNSAELLENGHILIADRNNRASRLRAAITSQDFSRRGTAILSRRQPPR